MRKALQVGFHIQTDLEVPNAMEKYQLGAEQGAVGTGLQHMQASPLSKQQLF